VVGALAILAAIALAAPPGAGREAYRPTTLARALERCRERAAGGDVALARDGYLVHAVLVGPRRPVPAERRSFIARWTRSAGVRPGAASLYAEEVLVREGSLSAWLPVQAPVASRIEKELRPGDAADLQLLWAGASGGDCVFLLNEFEAQRPR
jgi:hypothetical protein